MYVCTHRLLSSSFLGLPYRILNMNHKKELLRYVCMYVCMYVFMYVCMYVCTYVRMYVCMYEGMKVFINACLYVRVLMYRAGGWQTRIDKGVRTLSLVYNNYL